MNCFANLLVFLLSSHLIAGNLINHTVSNQGEYVAITITSKAPAHISAQGIWADEILLTPSTNNITLPHTIKIKRESQPKSLTIYVCLDTGQCIAPYHIAMQSSHLTEWIGFGALSAISMVFNPCLTPVWLILSSQFTHSLLIHSAIMATTLTLYQILISTVGVGLIHQLHLYGLDQIAHALFCLLFLCLIFPDKIRLSLFTKASGQIPSYLAVILSASCLMPISLTSGLTAYNHQISDPLSITTIILTFLTISWISLALVAQISQKAYASIMKTMPMLIQLAGITGLFYYSTYYLTSTGLIVLLVICNIGLIVYTRAISEVRSILSSAVLGYALILPAATMQVLTQDESSVLEGAKKEGQHLFVTAQWCAECNQLKNKLGDSVLWMDITKIEPWQKTWLKAHPTEVLPGCFVAHKNEWVSCDNDDNYQWL